MVIGLRQHMRRARSGRCEKLLAVLRRTHEPDIAALSALLDGRLDAAPRRRFEAHIAACDACRARLDGLRACARRCARCRRSNAPRSFRLRPADVAGAAPARAAARRGAAHDAGAQRSARSPSVVVVLGGRPGRRRGCRRGPVAAPRHGRRRAALAADERPASARRRTPDEVDASVRRRQRRRYGPQTDGAAARRRRSPTTATRRRQHAPRCRRRPNERTLDNGATGASAAAPAPSRTTLNADDDRRCRAAEPTTARRHARHRRDDRRGRRGQRPAARHRLEDAEGERCSMKRHTKVLADRAALVRR